MDHHHHHMEGGSMGESLPVQQQQQQQQKQQQQQTQLQQQQQKLKKKSKNKKKSSRNEAPATAAPSAVAGTESKLLSPDLGKDGVVNNAKSSHDQEDAILALIGFCEQLKHQINLEDSNDTHSVDCLGPKVNGLVSEKCGSNGNINNACPQKTKNAIVSLENGSAANNQTPTKPSAPVLNGHHQKKDEEELEEAEVITKNDLKAPIKKTKRKPNNKKNPPNHLAATKENGHCPPAKTDEDDNRVEKSSSSKKESDLMENQNSENIKETIEETERESTLKEKETEIENENLKTAMTPESKVEKSEKNNESDEKQENTTEKSPLTAESPVSIETPLDLSNVHIEYKEYESELQMHDIMRLIQAELSEPYSIYTYRYFIYNWPKLCFLAAHGNEYVGAIVCKLGMHMNVRRGYIAMLAVRKEYRKLKIGTTLVQKAIEAMLADKADEVVLETEMSNIPALRLYENLGFVRDKRLFRYYLNGVDALRLKLWFR